MWLSLPGLRPAIAQTTISSGLPLLLPTTIAFDPSGNLYIAETNRHVIDRIDSSGLLTVYAGNGTQGFSGDSGPATSAQLDSPQGIALDASGNLYIADTHNHRIRKVNVATGLIVTIAGTGTTGFSGDSGPALAAHLSLPTALAVDSSSNLYIADSNNHRIRQVNPATGIINTIAGNGIQADMGDFGSALTASIDTPTGLVLDSSNNLYLADTHNHRVRKVAMATGIITTIAGGGTSLTATTATAAKLLLPRGLSFDSSGNLYVADTQTHRILRIAPDGTLIPAAGTGAQGFAGDNGPATAALLDRPHSVAISRTGLITLVDTGNQRVRQLDTTSSITTLYGIGNTTPSPLILTSPGTTQYGTGTVSATTPGTGSITLIDTSSNTTLSTAPLTVGTAIFSTSRLSTGTHTLLAIYSGDAAHPARQSTLAFLTITPAPVTVAPTPATITYGQPVPTLTGSISGILPQDANSISATFTTTAQALSSAATYPIATTLTGTSAANYQVTTLIPANLTIAQATTATALTATTLNASATLTARTVSTTQGTPTGRITFFDTGTSIGSTTLNAGSAAQTTTLASGTHTVTAVYSGDINFLSSTSASVTPVASTTALQDFTLATSGATTQTTTPGAIAVYTFTVSTQNGTLSSPILLTSSGMPPAATATFNPTLIRPGTASSIFTLTVQTASSAAQKRQPPVLFWSTFILLPLTLYRRRRPCLAALSAILLLASLTACGNTVSSNPKTTSATAVYPLTITATASSDTGATLQHTAVVTLTLQ